MMRPLSLHASALNNEEYDLYTACLIDLAWPDDADDANDQRRGPHDDAYYENLKIGARELRGWLRGRYAHVYPPSIDTILRLFSPDLRPTDTLTGGQFFAALRLVVHAESGKDVDRNLAFVQAHPISSKSKPPSPDPKKKRSTTPLRVKPDFALPTPDSSAESQTPSPTNPFSPPHALDSPRQPPQHPLIRHDVFPSPQPTATTHATHNPFVNRAVKQNHQDDAPRSKPPLPPRKPQHPKTQIQPALLPPPRHNSILLAPPERKSVSPASSPGSTTPTVKAAPPPPPKPVHATSALMKQSLQASKAAQTMKRAEEQLEQERVMQVLKSSSIVSGGYSLAGATVTGSSVVVGTNIRNRSSSPTKIVYAPATTNSLRQGNVGTAQDPSEPDDRAPPLPRRRPRREGSPTMSTTSLEQVALATSSAQSSSTTSALGSQNPYLSPFASTSTAAPVFSNTVTDSPHASPSRRSVDLPSSRPPTHPDRKPPHLPFQAPSSMSMLSSLPSTPAQHRSVLADTALGSTESSPTSRVFRSKSLHQPSPPLPPVPPPVRRKRPESVQVLPSGEILFSDSKTEPAADSSRPGSTLSRHTSLSTPAPGQGQGHRRSSHSISSAPSLSDLAAHHSSYHSLDAGSPLSNIQRTLATLQPKLDAARYKAEAGLSRRGFVRDGAIKKSGEEGEEEEGLMSEARGRRNRERDRSASRNRWGGAAEVVRRLSPDRGTLADSGVHSDDTGEDEEPWKRNIRNRWVDREREDLKWPAGEGWKPL